MKIRAKVLLLLALPLAGWAATELRVAAVILGAEPAATSPAAAPPAPPAEKPAAAPPAAVPPAKPDTPAPPPPAPPVPTPSPPLILTALQVEPARLVLQGKWAAYGIVVTGQLADGSVRDLSAAAQCTSANPAVAAVGPDGIIRPVADGEVPITVVAKLGESTASATVVVTVKEAASESTSFLRDVMPLFTKLGCNAIPCHGSTLGQGGFRLSMFGAEPDADYESLAKLHLGRRINRIEPLKSLVLLKATNTVAHTGGAKIQPNSAE